MTSSRDGGFILAGNSESNDGDVSENHGNSDGWIIKIDKEGKKVWQKAVGGSENDIFFWIAPDINGGYLITGHTESNISDVQVNGGIGDVWVIRIDENGNMISKKTLGGSKAEMSYYIKSTTDGGYILTGITRSNDGDVSGNHGSGDAWVVKFDKDGTIQWQKALGGSGSDIGISVTESSDGDFVVACLTTSNDGDLNTHYGGQDAWAVKLDKNGIIKWQKVLGGTNTDKVYAVETSSDGGFVFGGSTESNDGDVSGNHGKFDAWMIKLDKNGNKVWQHTYGGTEAELIESMTATSDNGYIMVGTTNSNDGDVSGNHGENDAWIVKTNSNGVLQWQKTLGGQNNENGFSIVEIKDKNYVFAGRANGNGGDVTGSLGLTDYWAVMLKHK
jgi:hypothetical protein